MSEHLLYLKKSYPYFNTQNMISCILRESAVMLGFIRHAALHLPFYTPEKVAFQQQKQQKEKKKSKGNFGYFSLQSNFLQIQTLLYPSGDEL